MKERNKKNAGREDRLPPLQHANHAALKMGMSQRKQRRQNGDFVRLRTGSQSRNFMECLKIPYSASRFCSYVIIMFVMRRLPCPLPFMAARNAETDDFGVSIKLSLV
jgi:hypothetical protein